MGALINFLVENYIYFVFIAILLILAFVGYIVDNSKTAKLKKELTGKSDDDVIEIPIADTTAKIGDAVNKMSMGGMNNVAPVAIASTAPQEITQPSPIDLAPVAVAPTDENTLQ